MVHDEFEDDLSDVEFDDDIDEAPDNKKREVKKRADDSKPKKKKAKASGDVEPKEERPKRTRQPAKARRPAKKKVVKPSVDEELPPVEDETLAGELVGDDGPNTAAKDIEPVADGGAADGGSADGGATDGGATDGGATDGGGSDDVVAEGESDVVPEPPKPGPEEVEPAEPDNQDAIVAIKEVCGRVDLNKFGRVWRIFLYELNTDEDAAQIHGFPMLKEVWLFGTKVTQEGCDKVKAAFPDAKVYY